MSDSRTLHFLSAGAAQGLVKALQAHFEAEQGITLQGRFGAVGAMKEALLAGEPCDLFIVTDAMVGELIASGALQGAPRGVLGRVRTGVAARAGEQLPAIGNADELRAALRAATALHFPDPQRATAGIHFAKVLAQLGIADELAPRLRTFPNGATAMAALAREAPVGALGCTQASEILYTDGVHLVGPLPAAFELATTYTAAVTVRAQQPEAARAFISLMAGPDTAALRAGGGFDA